MLGSLMFGQFWSGGTTTQVGGGSTGTVSLSVILYRRRKRRLH